MTEIDDRLLPLANALARCEVSETAAQLMNAATERGEDQLKAFLYATARHKLASIVSLLNISAVVEDRLMREGKINDDTPIDVLLRIWNQAQSNFDRTIEFIDKVLNMDHPKPLVPMLIDNRQINIGTAQVMNLETIPKDSRDKLRNMFERLERESKQPATNSQNPS